MALHIKLKNKPSHERARLKGLEIAKIKKLPRQNVKFSGADVDIEIIDIKSIKTGVEIFARAWQPNGEQIGFGEDGSVDIERFIIHNRKLREDPKETTLQSLAHTISLVGKDGTNIVKGKIGNTTSTFYSQAGSADHYDSFLRSDQVAGGVTWANVRTSFTGAFDSNTTASVRLRGGTTSGQWRTLDKGGHGFDTSAIGTDTVDSAILSIYGTGSQNTASYGGLSIDLDAYTPASETAGTSTDGNAANWDGVRQATGITFASFNTTGYNDFTLNATGIGNINKTGNSWFGFRPSADLDNAEPTWENNVESDVTFYHADNGSNKPKLVVVHSAAAAAAGRPNFLTLLGVS